MPIHRYETTPAERLVIACLCGTSRTVDLSAIQLGHDAGGDPMPNLVDLGACSCGKREYTQRTWDSIPEALVGTRFDILRRITNAIGKRMIALGRSEPSCAAIHAAETSDPPDMLDLVDGVEVPTS